MPQEKARNGDTDINPLRTSPTYQQNEISQKLSPNIRSTHNRQVVDDMIIVLYMPVEWDISDLNASVQLQDTDENTFSREQTVPLYIWADRNTSKDYKACIQQNGHQVGLIPLNDLKLYHGPEVTWKNAPSILQAQKLIRQSGQIS